MSTHQYDEASIKSLDWRAHIRLRPGMYIGKLGNGTAPDDGIYVLLKEVIDNSIDEYVMGHGRQIDIRVESQQATVRDYGRGIPLGKVVDCVAKINTGGKYDSKAFQKSVGLNGVGTKAVNALSAHFVVQAFREGQTNTATFTQGQLVEETGTLPTKEREGTLMTFRPDPEIFGEYHFRTPFIEEQVRFYTFLNAGLTVTLNGKKFAAKEGLADLLAHKVDEENQCYPPIHLRGNDMEVALTHTQEYGETYYSFVNGQFTTQGGTHLAAFREAVVKVVREFYKKDFDAADIRSSLTGAVSLRIQEPLFESQTKTKLGSPQMGPEGPTVRSFVNDFMKQRLDDFLHKNPAVAEALQARIVQAEKERKEVAGVKKLANERAKKASLHNKKLRDCRVHLCSTHERREETMLFITEGNSATGSITKARDVHTQAVFSLRGKPLNCYGQSKRLVYENEEFNLLQHALDLEAGLEKLRYNKIVMATDADVDGMHIRLLLLTYFLQYFPELVRKGHLYILETPLFRVRNKQETRYCYSEEERLAALAALGTNPEITRFKGLGEISADEFKHFIGKDMRLLPVNLQPGTSLKQLLAFYMGKNTPERQTFIIDHLRVEQDVVEEVA